MDRFLKYSLLILFIMVLPIGIFYNPGFPYYVLENLREGSIYAWVLWNSILGGGVGIIYFLVHCGCKMRGVIVLGAVSILTGLLLVHLFPSVLYFETLTGDGIIRDDSGTLGPNAKILMFFWHLGIMLDAFILIWVILIQEFFRFNKNKFQLILGRKEK